MSHRILYCHCAFARVVPAEVKNQVLVKLAESGQPFDAVPDLCEMSARRDARLAEFAGCQNLRIAACYPRAVQWLFSAAAAPLDTKRAEILNMRERPADEIAGSLLRVGP